MGVNQYQYNRRLAAGMKEEMNGGGKFFCLAAAGVIVEESIMEDILLRLPVKSLIRFKSVCKTWCSLISNPHFARAHLSRSLNNPNSSHERLLLLVSNPDIQYALKSFNYEAVSSNFQEVANNDLYLLDFPGSCRFGLPKSSIVSIRVHSSCDGLVCLYIRGDDYHTIIIWNPTTGDFKQIPAPTSSILCDFWIVGFGYDPASGDYKILALCLGRKLMIYTLKHKSSWRSLGNCHDYTPSGGGVYLNGCFHWLAAPNILSFDLSDEKFKVVVIPLPQDIVEHAAVYGSLAVLRGCLFVYAGNCDVGASKCWKLMMGDEYWTELCNLRCYQGRECLRYAVCTRNDGKVLFHLFDDYKSYGREKHFLCLYSGEDNSSQLARFDNLLLSPQLYVESLISP